MRRIVFAGLGLFAAFQGRFALAGETLSGHPIVLDGDTMRLRGTIVGLYGVAAPGPNQRCESRSGRSTQCGATAFRALSKRIGTASITCETTGGDKHQRTLATCRIGDEDLGGWMVTNGLAVADRLATREYVPHSMQAWAHRRGLWAGVFEDPIDRVREDYSAMMKLSAASR